MNIKRRTLVIGLGGTGCYSLRCVKKALQDAELIPLDDIKERTDRKSNERIRSSPVRFLAIDLDERSEKEKAPYYADIQDDFMLLEKLKIEQKVKYIDLQENRIYWSWYPDKDRHHIKLKQAQYGAGQWRPLGRLAYCEEQGFIESRIYDALQELASIPVTKDMDTKDIEVCILSSTAGGTGSGMLLDIAYYLQKSQVLQDDNIRITTYAFLLLPDIFEKVDHAYRTKPNTYASLKELHGFFRQEADFDMFYPHRTEHFKVEAGKSVPFSNIYLINKDLSEVELTSPQDCFKYMGSIAYLRMISELSSQAKSSFANERVPQKIKGMEDDLIQSGYVFSSCSGGLVQFPAPQKLAQTILASSIIERQEKEIEKLAANLAYWKSSEWNVRFENILSGWHLEVIAEFWREFKKRILMSIRAVTERWVAENRKPDPKFLEEHVKDWQSELKKRIETLMEKNTESLIEHLTLDKILAAGVDGETVSASLILEILNIISSSLKTVVDNHNGPDISEISPFDFVAQINDTQEEIEKYLNNMTQLSSWLFFRTSFVQGNLDRIEAKVLELKNLLTEDAESATIDAYMAGALKSHIAEKTRSILENKIYHLEENIGLIELALGNVSKRMKNYADVTLAEDYLREGHPDERLINKLDISTTTILEAIETSDGFLESRFDRIVNRHLFIGGEEGDEDFDLRKSKQNILAPLEINKSPDSEKIVDELARDLEVDIERGVIPVNTKKYIREISTVIGNSYISLFKNLKSESFAESSVFWSLPEYTFGRQYPFKNAETAEQIKATIKSLINRTFKACKQYYIHNTDNSFLFYHETHHHPPENIPGIVGYRNDYKCVPFPIEFLHVHKAYAESFGDLIAPELQETYCGNSGCSFNIAPLPRDVNICPSCDNPILNRCGNTLPDCEVDNLIEKLGGLEEIDKKKIICPGCNRPIRTFWWNCDKHGLQWRDKNESFCPECTKEAEKRVIKFSERTIKDDDRTYPIFCIQCKERGEKDPFLIPQPSLYFDVPKYKYPLLEKTLHEENIENNLCPVCGAHLFPQCPHAGEDIPIHYVERDSEGRLVCTFFNKHKETVQKIYECFHCQYPLKVDDRKCPRCSMDLLICNHCSQDKGFLIPNDSLLDGDRCPVCKYQIKVKNA